MEYAVYEGKIDGIGESTSPEDPVGEFQPTSAYYIPSSIEGGLYNIQLVLCGEGVSVSKQADGSLGFKGSGKAVQLQVISSNPDIEDGTYTSSACDYDSPIFANNTFLKGYTYMYLGLLPIPIYSQFIDVINGQSSAIEAVDDGEAGFLTLGDSRLVTLSSSAVSYSAMLKLIRL